MSADQDFRSAVEEARSLRIHRSAGLRFALWSFGISSVCSLVPVVTTWILMPSQTQLNQARRSLDRLTADIARLSRDGGRADLRRCGEASRLCVRVDRKAPFYGANADYAVLKGY